MKTGSAEDLPVEFNHIRKEQDFLRADAAIEQLGVPQAALLEPRARDGTVRQLAASGMGVGGLIDCIPEVGEVMVLTRNEYGIHEKTGTFENMGSTSNMDSAFHRETNLPINVRGAQPLINPGSFRAGPAHKARRRLARYSLSALQFVFER